MRIAVGGFQHETNTFAPVKADFDKFERKDGWPGLHHGQAMLDAVDGVHLPVTGGIEALKDLGHEILPLLWCSATPSAHVTEDAFERIAGMMLEDLAAAGPVDGIYLDLHGAAVCEHLEDGEGELLRRIRAQVGPDLPIAVSLDLHANVTPEMVDHASVLDIYRTYPHVDMGETGARAARLLDQLLQMPEGQRRFTKAFRQAQFLIPLNWGCTYMDPAKTIYEVHLPELLEADDGLVSLSFACGFALADIHHAGPAVVAYGLSQDAADHAADRLIGEVNAREAAFNGKIYSSPDGIAEARKIGAGASRPVILADTQDNPGGGGPGDTTGLLRAMVEAGAEGAILAMLIDAESAEAAHAAGEGATLSLALGGKEFPGDEPFVADCRVVKLGDGQFTATGPMWGGSRMALGPMALVETGGVRVVIASKSMQAGDTSMLRHLGIEPAEESLIGLKSSVHFRADFQPLAEDVLVVEAPGPVYADPAKLTFNNLRPGVRLTPGG